ncbi:Gfo/Idh/MocA family oxidoreductase [Chryseobacterium sp. SNU WT5]|uniref:Gfo/Idh/MocA family protein n=1 Tax=Chryseobacterium sp. SNU WT5 TaxID=2594269 RepID=UPI0011802EBD|nr:Gfo/Idh/MocA family oxidoreductase [Chryseobacterium sp. SNU WT5]QDP85854.1 Gfo/Idh/MocA family oxidoreductase [Chryseobacterium sp. SNU WT5]
MNNKIKIAVLGYGNIGKRHVEVILNNAEFKIIAVIESVFTECPLLDKASIPIFEDLSKFFSADLKVDFIAVCTPNGLHFQHAKSILEQNINVIIEKPITIESKHAEILTKIANEKDLKIFPVMQNRFSPPALWLKDLLDSKKLGKIFMVQVSCYWNRDERYYSKNSWRGTKNLDGGSLYTQFSHYLDILFWLFGDITNIISKLKDFNHQKLTEFEDSGIITFDFQSGGIGSFNFSTSVWQENLESSITIISEYGSVKVGGQYMEQVEKCLIKDYELPALSQTNACNDYGTYKGSAQNHHFLYQNIADMLNRNVKLRTQLDESVQLIERIEQIYSNKIERY